MIGTKLYRKKQRVVFFLVMYGLLALIGVGIAAQTVARGENPSAAVGFMVVFGAGMLILTLVKSRKPIVVIHGDRLDLNQSKYAELVRYRFIAGIDQPDANRLVISLRDDGSVKKITIWLRELEKSDAEKLAGFLKNKEWKKK